MKNSQDDSKRLYSDDYASIIHDQDYNPELDSSADSGEEESGGEDASRSASRSNLNKGH